MRVDPPHIKGPCKQGNLGFTPEHWKFHIVFHSGCTILHSHIPTDTPTFLPTLVFSFLNNSHPNGHEVMPH